MCEGGVATWNRSVGPRPSVWHQCAVPWPIERCVWRTAFGRPVVPELNTSTASSVSLAGSRRHLLVRTGPEGHSATIVDVDHAAFPEQLSQ